MTPKTLETIESILSDIEADFLPVMAELYDLIFREQVSSESELIFVKVVELYNHPAMSEHKSKHLFTSILEDEQTRLGAEHVYAFIQRLRNLKAFYPKDLDEAAKNVFRLIEDQTEFKFVYFRLVFMCGFFPYNENIWIVFEEDVGEEPGEESERAMDLMDHACWSLYNNEHLLLNYATHLIDSLHGNKVAQRDAIQTLMTAMKQAGILMIQSAVDDVHQKEKKAEHTLLSMPVQNQDRGLD